VEGVVGSSADAFESISTTLAEGSYDDIIVSTLPKKRSEWLRKDLPTRIETLGVPVSDLHASQEALGVAAQGPADPHRDPRRAGERDHPSRRAVGAAVVHRAVLGPGVRVIAPAG